MRLVSKSYGGDNTREVSNLLADGQMASILVSTHSWHRGDYDGAIGIQKWSLYQKSIFKRSGWLATFPYLGL
jgi:hypothetical protein